MPRKRRWHAIAGSLFGLQTDTYVRTKAMGIVDTRRWIAHMFDVAKRFPKDREWVDAKLTVAAERAWVVWQALNDAKAAFRRQFKLKDDGT